MHAYIGNIAIVADRYAVVYRQGTEVVDLGTDEPDEAEAIAEELVERWGVWGYHIPDASSIPAVYRDYDEAEASSLDQQQAAWWAQR
jgi:hypothetical protein